MRFVLIPLLLTASSSSLMAETKPRFSSDAIALFEELTMAYDLNGRRKPAGRFDETKLVRLQKSNEKEVAEVATKAPQLLWLNRLSKSQNKKVTKALEDQVKQWPVVITEHVIRAIGGSDAEKKDLRSAAKLLEDLMGSEDADSPQKAVNRAWSTACMGNGLGISMRDTMRKLANRSGSPVGNESKLVSVKANTDKLGAITLTNRSGRTLHHCLIFTRLEPDRERIQKLAREEDLVGALILPGLGFSKKTVDGSREAARLRYLFNAQEKGVMMYVAEIPAKGSVTTQLARPDYYRISKGADMSIWCDELAVDHLAAENWAEVMASLRKPAKRPLLPKKR